jgi:hypothetical protein
MLDNDSDTFCPNSPKERNRRDNFPLQVGSAAPCQLKEDSEEKENSIPSTTSKRFLQALVSQGEFEAG